MTDDLMKRLREVGGMSDDGATRWYINPDGLEAADRIEEIGAANDKLSCDTLQLYARIEKLEAEVESLQNIRHYGLRHIMRVQEGELPKDEVYGLPLFAEKNKVYPWPAENVELYAYWKRTDK